MGPLYKINDYDMYECGALLDKFNDLIVTKPMIQNAINEITKYMDDTSMSFFKQAIFIRILNNEMNMHQNISNVFGINLPSVDRMISPKVPNHRIWFGHNPKSTRFITEGLAISDSVSDGFYVLNLQLVPIANTDAVPTRPIIYDCHIVQKSKL